MEKVYRKNCSCLEYFCLFPSLCPQPQKGFCECFSVILQYMLFFFNKVKQSSVLGYSVPPILFYCCCLWVCVGNWITEFVLVHFCRPCSSWLMFAVYLLSSVTNNCIRVTKGIVICSRGAGDLSK